MGGSSFSFHTAVQAGTDGTSRLKPVRERPPLDTHPRIGPAIRAEEKLLGRSGRLVVRYSGTEPKARIMVEAESRQTMDECAERLRQLIEEEIGRKAG